MDNEYNVSTISYSESEREIVRKGIHAIREVLMGDDANKKRSLLFALDWFMDPYINRIITLLIFLMIGRAVTDGYYYFNDDEVADNALNLLSSYAWPPFEILENNINKVSERMKPYVLEVINMDNREE